MILTILNWSYVTILSLIIGTGFSVFIKKLRNRFIWEWDVVLMAGIMLMTAYAQFYSLFGGVGRNANLLLCILSTLIAWICRKEIKTVFSDMKGRLLTEKKEIIRFGILLAVAILFVAFSCQKAGHADTDGYHAQTIRWIEEYGAVKGLGNLYNRLAYNSAFMSLQALFSWKFLIGQSMHVMNGYLCCVMTLYGITQLWKKDRKQMLGNVMCLLLLFYIFVPQSLSMMSSPNTDTLALLLVLYILSKWCCYLESGKEEADFYAILCVFAVFAVSVKLSTALLVILALKPACCFVRKKDWGGIALYVVMGILVIAPYLIRNVVISGYLVYPYSVIDLFDVDWKMPAHMVDYDRREIMAWGRALNDVEKSDYGLIRWFPIWWNAQELWLKLLFAVNVILLPGGIVCSVRAVIRKKYDDVLLMVMAMILFLGWFFTAPLMRYGIVFAFLIPGIAFGYLCRWMKSKNVWQMAEISVFVVLAVFTMLEISDMDEISFKRSAYYIARECTSVNWNGIDIYLPVENGYMGYYYLPSTQHKSVLKYIELRGNDISDGFKIIDEYVGCKINTYGELEQK